MVIFFLWFVPLPSLYLPTKTKEAVYAVTRKAPPTEEEIRCSPRTQHAPVIINAGMGTTGTYSFFFATCLLGYPLLHWFTVCVPKDTVVEITDKIQKKNHYLCLNDDWQNLMQTQYNLTKQWRESITVRNAQSVLKNYRRLSWCTIHRIP